MPDSGGDSSSLPYVPMNFSMVDRFMHTGFRYGTHSGMASQS